MKYSVFIVIPFLWLSGCGGKSNLEPPSELEKFTPAAKIERLWSRNIGTSADEKYIKLSPVIDDNILYAADIEGKVSAINTETGKRLWRTKTKQAVSGAVGVGDDLVLLGTAQGKIIALDKGTGEQRWTTTVSSEVLSPPAASSGVVVVQTNDGKVYGLSSRDGTRIWVQQQNEPSLSLRGISPPVIIRGAAIAGFANGKIGGYVLNDGRVLWILPVSHSRGRSEIERVVDVDLSPLLLGDTLYAANYQGKVVAINVRSGRVLWSRNTSTFSGITADSSNLYISDDQGNVIALNLDNGSDVWKQEKLRGRWLNAPTIVGSYLAVGDFEGYVHILSREDGEFMARYRFGSEAIRAPILSQGNVMYVSSQNGRLVALRVD